jgi:hypothetical protein
LSRYHIVTTWRFDASVEEVGAILADVERLAQWWPSVYLAVREIAHGDPTGVGKEVELHTKGWLPYTLRWTFRVTEVEQGRVVLTPTGDFLGQGEWTFLQDGPTAVVRYDWDVEARKPVLRMLTWLLRPIFTANHNWAMRKGEKSLRLELARRAATTEEERSRVPPAPGPSFLTFGPARRPRDPRSDPSLP